MASGEKRSSCQVEPGRTCRIGRKLSEQRERETRRFMRQLTAGNGSRYAFELLT